jgi:hypothetical protein
MKSQELKRYLENIDYSSLYNSRFVQIRPGDTHSVWAKIISSHTAGMTVVITRVKRYSGTSGYTPSVGEVHFYPITNLRYKHTTEEEATSESTHGYGR